MNSIMNLIHTTFNNTTNHTQNFEVNKKIENNRQNCRCVVSKDSCFSSFKSGLVSLQLNSRWLYQKNLAYVKSILMGSPHSKW